MLLGHYAVALAAKRAVPKTSLGTLILGAQFADLVWPIFLLLGWERVRIVPGITRVSPFDFVAYPYSHSLLAQVLWGIGIGIFYFAIGRAPRSAVVLALCVPSHWLLDFIVHRPDMPLVPGGGRYGLGLWNSLPATLAIEFALFAAGIALYLTGTRAKDRTGTYALWSLLLLLLLAYVGSILGPPPPNERAIAISALALWLTVAWAAWADRHRQIRPST